MCFIFNSEESKKQKVAKEAIICYKILTKDLRDPYYSRFRYQIGIINPKVRLAKRFSSLLDKLIISEGYHSYINPIDNFDIESLWTNGIDIDEIKIFKAVIPAGTEYYMNDVHYVSETIIIKEEIK